jgi:hypothetical protein
LTGADALTNAEISLNIKDFTTVKKVREVGGTAANNPLPGNSKDNLVHRETGEKLAVASP